jgi:hypothetical protein
MKAEQIIKIADQLIRLAWSSKVLPIGSHFDTLSTIKNLVNQLEYCGYSFKEFKADYPSGWEAVFQFACSVQNNQAA